MDQASWQAFIDKHGGLAGSPVVVNPTTGTLVAGETINKPTQDPFYRYTFKDGSTIEVNKAGEIKDMSERTAPSQASQAGPAPSVSTTAPKIPQFNATTKQYEWVPNPNYAGAPNAGAPTPVSAPPNEQNIMVRDPQWGVLSAVPNPNYVAPRDPKAVVQLGNAVYERQPDGSYTKVLTGDKAPHVVAGTSTNDQFLIVEDANGNRSNLPNPNYVAPKPSVISGTNTSEPFIVRQNPDGTTSKEPNPNYVAPKPSVVSTNTDAPNIVTLDQDGNLQTHPNPNYSNKPEIVPGFQGGDRLPVLQRKPDGSGYDLTWVPNNGRVMVDAAIFNQFFPALKGIVGDGKGQVPLDVAKDWATQAYNVVQQQQQGQRDQDTYVNNQTRTAADYAANLYKNIAPPGLSQDAQSIQTALQNHTAVGPMPVRTMDVPDPTSFVHNAAAQALADRSQAAAQHLTGQVPFQGPQTGGAPPDASGGGHTFTFNFNVPTGGGSPAPAPSTPMPTFQGPQPAPAA